MTSPKVLTKTPSTRPVYNGRTDLSPEERYSRAHRKIFKAKTEREKWLVLFGLVSHLLDGVPECQRRALLMAAVWRLAKSNVLTLSRRKYVENILAVGHDASVILGDTLPGFGRLEADRIAVDAFHLMPHKAFKRWKKTHAAREI